MQRILPLTLLGLILTFPESGLAQRPEVYGRWKNSQLGVAPPDLLIPISSGRRGTSEGLIGGWAQPIGGDPHAALFDARTGELIELDQTPGSDVADISDNGYVVVEGFQSQDYLSAVLFFDTEAGTREVIYSGQGLHETPRVNNHGEVAFYNNYSGVWVWPQMINLPIAEEFDPLLIEHGIIEGEIGQVTVSSFSDEGWVSGKIATPNPSRTRAFLWNFHTDEFFRLDDPQFDGMETQATAVGPDGRAVVEVGRPGQPEEVYRWDGTLLEPLDPQGPLFVGRFPMVDVNASGQAVGGQAVRINDAGQVVSLGSGPRVYDPACECQRSTVSISRSDPLHVEGDYDASGNIDQGDLDLVLLNWGGDALPDTWYHDFPYLPIEQTELDEVLLRWGRAVGTPVLPPDAAPVPEPSTFVLLMLAAVLCTRRRK